MDSFANYCLPGKDDHSSAIYAGRRHFGQMTRAIVPFLKKHVPGEPTIKFEFMPGSGGTKAANHIFSNVRPDGLTIGRIGGGLIANAVLRETGVRYDLNKFIYLGSSHSTYHWVFL